MSKCGASLVSFSIKLKMVEEAFMTLKYEFKTITVRSVYLWH